MRPDPLFHNQVLTNKITSYSDDLYIIPTRTDCGRFLFTDKLSILALLIQETLVMYQ